MAETHLITKYTLYNQKLACFFSGPYVADADRCPEIEAVGAQGGADEDSRKQNVLTDVIC